MKKASRRPLAVERRPLAAPIPQLAYLELPPPPQTPDTCDVLIVGTGLVHSVLAAALAWAGSNVLHIDQNEYYGDSLATMTVEQLKVFEAGCKEPDALSKKLESLSLDDQDMVPPYSEVSLTTNSAPHLPLAYGIDLLPKVLFARLDMVSLLVSLRVHKYLEFQPLSAFHVYEHDNLEKMSASKEDVFCDKLLGLAQKRALMRFVKFVASWESQKPVWLPYKDKPISEFLESHFKLPQTQIDEIIFLLGLCHSRLLRTPEALQRVKRYLSSYDVYGRFPVLYTRYGGPGEVLQGFCRSAAVAGTTYKLQTGLELYDAQTGLVCLSDGLKVRVKEKLVILPSQAPLGLRPAKRTLNTVKRMVAVVGKDCQEWFAPGEHAAVVVFPEGALDSQNKKAVQVLVMGPGSQICPEGQAVWYLQTTEEGEQGTKDLRAACKLLEDSIERESNVDKWVTPEDIEYKNGQPSLLLVKLGSSVANFVPDEQLEYVLKMEYQQKTSVPHFGVVDKTFFEAEAEEKAQGTWTELQDQVLFSLMPLLEISYDGVITEAKALYAKITGSDDDFFVVDFEDEGEVMETGGMAGDDALVMEDIGDVAIESDEELTI